MHFWPQVWGSDRIQTAHIAEAIRLRSAAKAGVALQ